MLEKNKNLKLHLEKTPTKQYNIKTQRSQSTENTNSIIVINSRNEKSESAKNLHKYSSFIKKNKIDLESINNYLLSNVESIDKENSKLKELINELMEELKEKEKSLNDSLNIISKLKENYSLLFNEFNKNEKKMKKLNEEIHNLGKYKSENEKITQSNEFLKNEYNNNKKDLEQLKKILNTKNLEMNKTNQELNNVTIAFNEMKKKSGNWINMIKERENLLNGYEEKIKSLNEVIERKDGELKILEKYTKNINKDNKYNIKELTKQACNTIKLFHNNKDEVNGEYKINILLEGNFYNFEDFFKSHFENKNCIINLEEGIKDLLYIPETLEKSLNKEYLIDMNFKSDLIKLELMSSYIRELNFINFLQNSIGNITNKDININEIAAKLLLMKSSLKNNINNSNYVTLGKSQEEKNEENQIIKALKNKINDLYLTINQLYGSFQYINQQLKNKINILASGYNSELELLKENLEEANLNQGKLIKVIRDNNIMIDDDFNAPKLISNLYKPRKIVSFYIPGIIQIKNTEDYQDFYNSENYNEIKVLNFTQKEPINKSLSNSRGNNNDRNYLLKKVENEKLKKEVQRLKNEITILLKDSSNDSQPINNKRNQINYSTKNISSRGNSNNLTNSTYSNLSKNIQNYIYFLNRKIFSSSEYEKYKEIYNSNNLNEIISIFKERVILIIEKFKEIKLFYDSTLSTIDVDNAFNQQNQINQIIGNIVYFNRVKNPNDILYEYKTLNEEILKLKNEKLLTDGLIELIKNYLIAIEQIYNVGQNNNMNISLNKNYFDEIKKIFLNGCCFKIDEITDDQIFIRNLIFKLFEVLNCV